MLKSGKFETFIKYHYLALKESFEEINRMETNDDIDEEIRRLIQLSKLIARDLGIAAPKDETRRSVITDLFENGISVALEEDLSNLCFLSVLESFVNKLTPSDKKKIIKYFDSLVNLFPIETINLLKSLGSSSPRYSAYVNFRDKLCGVKPSGLAVTSGIKSKKGAAKKKPTRSRKRQVNGSDDDGGEEEEEEEEEIENVKEDELHVAVEKLSVSKKRKSFEGKGKKSAAKEESESEGSQVVRTVDSYLEEEEDDDDDDDEGGEDVKKPASKKQRIDKKSSESSHDSAHVEVTNFFLVTLPPYPLTPSLVIFFQSSLSCRC
jgi:hypothetical protein